MAAYKGKVANMLHVMFLDALEKEAKAFLDKTVEIIDNNGHPEFFEHETKNLRDSYGFGVFYNGKLERRGWTDPTADAPREFPDGSVLWGKEAIQTLFNGSDRTSSKGYVIMIAAAMPYAINLETGYRMPHKYKVISFMDVVAERFGQSITGKPLVSKVIVREYGKATEW